MSRAQMNQAQVLYTTTQDTMKRHENGVTKNRKAPLTGSGRAWREDEEAYLLQSRLQKMPYKHIAAHLNKTELACRLHHHQLSHGSARRKRSGSCSSGSSDPCPRGRIDDVSFSPICRSETRSLSPAAMGSPYLPRSFNNDMQLPPIRSVEDSPRFPSLFPRSEGPAYPQQHASESLSRYSTRTPDLQHRNLTSGYSSRHQSPVPFQPAATPLRLDISRVSSPSPLVHTSEHVELPRLGAIYESHKSTFWAVVADEYGMDASPVVLEQAWRSGACCQHGSKYSQSNSRPMTPMDSPDKERRTLAYRLSSYEKTRISSIIDDDTGSRFH